MTTQHTSAHVCTTLPSGDVPMRDRFLYQPSGAMHLISACGNVKRYMCPQYPAKYPFVPIGTWMGREERKGSDGTWWTQDTEPDYWVVDNVGDLVRVTSQKGGAA